MRGAGVLEAGRGRDDAALLCRCSGGEFVEAARILWGFFTGWNERGGCPLSSGWISPYCKVLGEKKREHKERGLPFSRLDHLGVLLCFVLSITSIDFPPRIFNKGKEALIFIFNQIR